MKQISFSQVEYAGKKRTTGGKYSLPKWSR